MERRIGEAFLVLQVRNSERTTAEEVTPYTDGA